MDENEPGTSQQEPGFTGEQERQGWSLTKSILCVPQLGGGGGQRAHSMCQYTDHYWDRQIYTFYSLYLKTLAETIEATLLSPECAWILILVSKHGAGTRRIPRLPS